MFILCLFLDNISDVWVYNPVALYTFCLQSVNFFGDF